MKYIWEAQDVVPGREVDSHNRAERYKIGYDASINHEDGNLVLFSLLDGSMVKKGVTEEGMADHLNQAKMRAVTILEEDIEPRND